MHRISPPLVAVAVALTGALPLRDTLAQDRALSITPSVGAYFSATDLVDGEELVGPAGGSENITVRQQVGPTVGLRGSYRLFGRLGLEAEAVLAFSEVELEFASADGGAVTRDARVFVFGAGLSYDVLRLPFTPFAAHVAGGVGLTARGGEFFSEGGDVVEDLEGGTDFAVVIGSGFRYGLDPKVSLRVDLRDYISSYAQMVAGIKLESQLQHEVWVSLGLEFAL